MAITFKPGRQEVSTATVTFNLADLTNGSAVAAVKLPQNARIVGGLVKIETAFNSGTNDALVIQSNEGTPKAYVTISAALNSLTAGLATAFAVTNLGFINTSPSTIDVKWTGTGTAATTGSGTLIVQYVVEGRSEFAQG